MTKTTTLPEFSEHIWIYDHETFNLKYHYNTFRTSFGNLFDRRNSSNMNKSFFRALQDQVYEFRDRGLLPKG